MVYYRIGKLNIGSQMVLSNVFEPFKSYVTSSDFNIEIEEEKIEECAAEFSIATEQVEISKLVEGYEFRYIPFGWKSGKTSVLRIDSDYSAASVTEGCGQEYLIRLALESRLAKEGCISLHSSCIIAPDKKAVCMTGRSGIGKSTRAAAWMKAMKLEAISGDRPLIDTKELNVYGVPWDGKEGLYKQVKAPLGSILNIIRADGSEGDVVIKGDTDVTVNTHVRKMDEEEAYKVLIAQTFMPMWDTDLAVTVMANLKRLCANASVMQLTSGPDEKSAVYSWDKIRRLS